MNRTDEDVDVMEVSSVPTTSLPASVVNGELASNNNTTESLFAVSTMDDSTAATISPDTTASQNRTSSLSGITPTPHVSNPCSNDNPHWDKGTQPCPNSTTDWIFDGVITTVSSTIATTTDEETFTTSQVAEDLPSTYSCIETNTVNEALSNTNEIDKEAIYFRFDYEMYTVPNQTNDNLKDVLREFEKKLGYGVASAVGLTDCPELANGQTERYVRRSLRRRGLKSTERFGFVGVSIEPLDIIDDAIREFRLIYFLVKQLCILNSRYRFNSKLHITGKSHLPKRMHTHPRIHDRMARNG
jgi:hypothetical protein